MTTATARSTTLPRRMKSRNSLIMPPGSSHAASCRRALRCLIEIPKGSRNKYEYDERARRHQARPLPVLLGRLPGRLRLHPGHAGPRTATAGRDGAGRLADVPGLRDRGARDRGPAHDRRPRQDDKIICVPHRTRTGAASRTSTTFRRSCVRDRALLLDLQAARGDRRRPSTGFEDRGDALAIEERASASVAAIGLDRRQQLLAGREAAHVLLHAPGEVAVHRRRRVRDVRRDQRPRRRPQRVAVRAAARGR